MKAKRIKFVLRTVGAPLAISVGLLTTLTIVPAGSATVSGTTISTRTGAFGTMLEVGAGKYAGYTNRGTGGEPEASGNRTTVRDWQTGDLRGPPALLFRDLTRSNHRRGLGRAEHPTMGRPVVPRIADGQPSCVARHAHDTEGR